MSGGKRGSTGASVALRSRRVRSTVSKSRSGRRWTCARAWARRASSLAKSATVGHVTRRTEPLGSSSTRWAGVDSMRSRPTVSTSFGPKTLSQHTS